MKCEGRVACGVIEQGYLFLFACFYMGVSKEKGHKKKEEGRGTRRVCHRKGGCCWTP